jgi:hypothetical protein
LNAARGDLKTDEDYRKAISELRNAAENQFASDSLKPALESYLVANGHYPASLSDLQQYFPSPVDASALQRWEITPKITVPNVGMGPTIITQVAPVDED